MTDFIPHSRPTINFFDIESVTTQLKSNLLAKGVKVEEFEKLIALSTNVKYATCTSSGSSALQIILLALNLPKLSEVILPSYVCKSVYNCVTALNLIPVLCDIGPNWVMNFETVQNKISLKTGAIILVHTFGIDCWDEKFSDLKIPIIEDFCQGYALHRYTGRTLKGIAGFCSFNATKYLTTGEGGAVITSDQTLQNNMINIISSAAISTIFSDYQASLGISQLNQFPDFVTERKRISEKYIASIKNTFLTAPFLKIKDKSICFRFLVRTGFNTDEIIADAQKENMALRKGVDSILHAAEDDSDFSTTVSTFNSTLSLPLYPSLTELQQDKVINFINKRL